MNNESTCCSLPETEKSARATSSCPARELAEPTWNATPRDDGADIEISLPGVRKEDLKVEVSGSLLRVEATRSTGGPDGRLIHGEAAPDGYRLELRLGPSLDGGSLNARLESGLLRLEIPLIEEARPKRVEIV